MNHQSLDIFINGNVAVTNIVLTWRLEDMGDPHGYLEMKVEAGVCRKNPTSSLRPAIVECL